MLLDLDPMYSRTSPPPARLVERIKRVGGLDTDEEAETAIRATLLALGEWLPDQNHAGLGKVLAPQSGDAATRIARRFDFVIHDFFARVQHYGETNPVMARKQALAACRVLGESMSRETLVGLAQTLPTALMDLLRPPSSVRPSAPAPAPASVHAVSSPSGTWPMRIPSAPRLPSDEEFHAATGASWPKRA